MRGEKRRCCDCGTSIVLANSGPTYTDVLCWECNSEMNFVEYVDVEYIGHMNSDDDYEIVKDD